MGNHGADYDHTFRGCTMEKNVLREKTFSFSVQVIRLYRVLAKNRGDEVLTRQLLRSATSIGANVREAVYGVSRADFVAKLQIALKETAETEYWLELLQETGALEKSTALQLLQQCLEIKRILIATLKTTKGDSSS